MNTRNLTLLALLAISLNSQAAQNQQQTFYTGGGCASIPGVGSPILMISNAHKYIEDALNIKNSYTTVKYLYSNQTSTGATNGQIVFRLAFSITDYNGTKFIGVELASSPFGIGGITINKFLLSSNVAVLTRFIDPAITATTSITCGDLKFVYSSYGNDSSTPLDYNYIGRNRTSAGLNVLNNLNQNNSNAANNKTCVSANFLETATFYGTPNNVTPVDLLNCLPNKNAVSAINVGCVNGAVTSLQLVYNNISDNGTTTSSIVGNPNTGINNITSIALGNSDRITFTSFTNPTALNIKTLDKNGATLTNYSCGTSATTSVSFTLATSDFLGLTKITGDNNAITSFQLTQYNNNA